MLRSIRFLRCLEQVSRLATLAVVLLMFAAYSLDVAIADPATLQRASSSSIGMHALRAQMMPSLSISRTPERPAGACRPPLTLCGAAIKALEQGAFLDFRASQEGERTTARLLSPFDVVRIDPLDRGRCPAKLCAAHVALEGVLGDLLREGYYTQSVALFPGSAVMTLRTERIGRDTKALKGSCRFNLDPACVDSNAWLQEDQRSGSPCGFAQTRVFLAASTAPDFVQAAAFTPASNPAAAGVEALRLAAFDAGNVKVYELIYIHKICRNEMALVRNG